MKRKVYVKQMKMLKEKSKSKDKGHIKRKDTARAPSNVTSHASPEVQEPPPHNEEYSESRTFSTSSPSSSQSSVASSSEWTTPPSSTILGNTTPLPKVDVLMKSSGIRAFQLRPNQIPHHEEATAQSPGYADNEETSIPVYKQNGTALSQMHTPGEQDNLNVDRWPKDPSVDESQRSSLSPVPMSSPYRMEYPGPYNVNVEQVDSLPETREMQNSSPVFHQLQVSRVNERVFNSESGSSDMSHYAERHQTHPDPYAIEMGSTGLMHDHQVPSILRYGHETTQQFDNGPQANHNQVRTWEQENYRYVDFTWRHGRSVEEKDAIYDDSTVGDKHSINHANTNVLDESMDLSNKTPRPAVSKSGSGSGSGRRRRKRVQTPVQRSAANMRERRRMCHLNVAFDYLKEHLPNVKDKKKLSRIQTLKAAIYYIHLLQDSLNVH